MAKTRSRPVVEQPPKPSAPRRWPFLAMAVVVCCILVGVAIFQWWINQPVVPSGPSGTGSHTALLSASHPYPIPAVASPPHVSHPISSGTVHSASTSHPVHATASMAMAPASATTRPHATAPTLIHPPITSGNTASAPPTNNASTAHLNPLPAGFEPEAYRQTEKERWAFAGLPRPVGTGTEYRLLRRQAYVLGYSEDRKDPLWVAYRLDGQEGSEALKRPGGFRTDKQTSAKVTTKAYVNSGYDRGHMAPNSAIARRFGEGAQLETFLMSNVIPQAPELNQGIWEKLERREEKYANSFGHIYVFTGPIFDSRKEYLQNLKTQESYEVEIPDAIFKILVKEDGNDIKILAFRFPNGLGDVPRDEKNFAKYLTTVDQIEKETGLDFFTALSDTIEESLESSRASTPWEIRESRSPRSSD